MSNKQMVLDTLEPYNNYRPTGKTVVNITSELPLKRTQVRNALSTLVREGLAQVEETGVDGYFSTYVLRER